MHTLIIGAGFSGSRIAVEAAAHGSVVGTRRSEGGAEELRRQGIEACVFDGSEHAALLEELRRTTHLFICVAPARELPLNEPVLSFLESLLAGGEDRSLSPFSGSLEWIGYLSTIGVYGDHGGNWVDEDTACGSRQTRSLARREAELCWQSTARKLGVPISILRLSGIYGPGRNAIADAIAGRARMLNKPGQFFNRIHVDDLAAAAMQAALRRYDGILNITDDTPAAPQDVIRHAHALAGRPAPPEVDFATAELSAMARSFYSENKRVSNRRSKQVLDYQYRYPDYREGLEAIWEELRQRDSGDHRPVAGEEDSASAT